jgi:ubiquinol-cytochrome c reductase cytochrome c subunit
MTRDILMRMHFVAGVTVAALMGTGAAFAQSSAAPATTPQGDAAAGKRAFTEYACYYCHGTVGQGSTAAIGPRVARVARSFDSFKNYVRRPTGRMSSYPASVVGDDTIAHIYAYLRSLPEPPKALPAALEQLRKR